MKITKATITKTVTEEVTKALYTEEDIRNLITNHLLDQGYKLTKDSTIAFDDMYDDYTDNEVLFAEVMVEPAYTVQKAFQPDKTEPQTENETNDNDNVNDLKTYIKDFKAYTKALDYIQDVLIKEGFKYLTRDEDSALKAFKDTPYMKENSCGGFWMVDDKQYKCLNIPLMDKAYRIPEEIRWIFNFIKWEDYDYYTMREVIQELENSMRSVEDLYHLKRVGTSREEYDNIEA